MSLQTFLSVGHIYYYTNVRGPNIIRNVIVSGYVTFDQISKFFVNIIFSLLAKWLRGPWFGDPGLIWKSAVSVKSTDWTRI